MSGRQRAVLALFAFVLAVVVVAIAGARQRARVLAPPWQEEALAAERRQPSPRAETSTGATVLFRYRAGGPITSEVAFDSQGRIYLTSHDGHLHALEADGRLRFKRSLGDGAEGTGAPPPAWGGPLVDHRARVWAGSDAGVLRVFSPAGELLHQAELPGPIDRAPVALPSGGALVVSGRTVTAFGDDLRPRYRFEASDKVFARPAVDAAGRVYLAAQDDLLRGLDAEGGLRFEYRAAGDLDGAPLWTGDRVYVGSDDGRVHAVSARDGSRVWSTSLGGYVRAPLAIGAGGVIVASTFGPVPRVVALDAGEGHLRWSWSPAPTDSTERGFHGGPRVGPGGRVYVGGRDHLYALSSRGALRYRLAVRGQIRATPALRADGAVVFGTDAGLLYAVRE